MVSEKKPRKPSTGQLNPRRKVSKKHWIAVVWLFSLLVLAVLVVLAGYGIQHMLQRQQPVSSRLSPPPADRSVPPAIDDAAPETAPALTVSIPPQTQTPPGPPRPSPITQAAPTTSTPAPVEVAPKHDYQPGIPEPISPRPGDMQGLPQVAIIIDDLGHNWPRARQFMEIDSNLTLAILPKAAHTREVALAALHSGREVMLHLPMEPEGYPGVDPGPQALLSEMSADELTAQLEENLAAFPGIAGVNNHMGSKLTSLAEPMDQIAGCLKQKGLYFIDSLTTNHSVARDSARKLKLPFAQRAVFLDHEPEPERIRHQIKALVAYAETHGQAVGIGHPHRQTLAVLSAELPQIKHQVQLVRASEIVQVLGTDP